MPGIELFSPAEIGAVAGVPLKSVYKVIEQRLPGGLVVRRQRQRLLTRWGAVCVVIDHKMPKDVPVTVRKQLYAQIRGSMSSRVIKCKHGILQYIVDVKALARVRFKVMRLMLSIRESRGLAYGGGETERRGVFGNS